MCDFMKRNGLEYPLDDAGRISGDTAEPASSRKKPLPTSRIRKDIERGKP
jgi:hypothetical protein